MHYRKTKSVSLLTLLKMYWFPKAMAENSTVAKLFTMALYKHTLVECESIPPSRTYHVERGQTSYILIRYTDEFKFPAAGFTTREHVSVCSV